MSRNSPPAVLNSRWSDGRPRQSTPQLQFELRKHALARMHIAESGQPPFLEIGYIHFVRFELGFLLCLLLGLASGSFLQQSGRTCRAAETFDVVALAVLLLDAIFVSESRRLRDTQVAGVGSVDIKGIEGCEEEAV